MDNYLGDDDNSKKELYQLIALSKILNPIEYINGDSNLQFKEGSSRNWNKIWK